MFSSPYVMMDANKIKFPFMKAEALFYYLVYNKRATRDELVALFWSDNDERNAKKNLRNAIYKLKKAFDIDIIISPQKSTVYINESIEVKTDFEDFLKDNSNSYDGYNGEFLKGFIVKNAEGFNKWADNKRIDLRELYINKLSFLLDQYFDSDDLKNAEKVLKLLIKEDEYEEMNYRLLITLYKNQGSYLKALELYDKLKELLSNNLGVEPSEETQNIIKKIPVLKKNTKQNKADLFLGRYSELGRLFDGYITYCSSKNHHRHFLIRGEAGIGKTALKNQFLRKLSKSKDLIVLETNCYQDEYDYFFKPWNAIFTKLGSYINSSEIIIPDAWKKVVGRIFPSFIGEYNDEINSQLNDIDIVKFEVIQSTICRVFEKISKGKKIILVFEDIHWMNETSVKLLLGLLHNSDVLFVGTSRNESNRSLSTLKASLTHEDQLAVIKMQRFNNNEINDFIDAYGKSDISVDIRRSILKETEGNPFYLKEYLDIYNEKGTLISGLSSKMEDVIASKFMSLSLMQKRIIEVISIFFDKAPLNIIAKIMKEDELSMIDEIEALSKLNIINEIISDDIGYSFSHQKLRAYVYENLIVGKKRLLHNKIGQIIEENMKSSDKSSEIFTDLIYHYSNANNHKKRVEYTIKYLDTYLYVQDELYPVNSISISSDVFKFDREDVERYFNDIDETMNKISQDDEELIQLKIMYYHLKGRYLIKVGKYVEGLKIIKEMIEMSLEIKNLQYAIKGYRQKIYYGVQVNDLEFMSVNIEAGLAVVEDTEYLEDKAIILRLKGLYHLLNKEYEQSEENLRKSMDLFASIGDRYKLNIAACYNYIGGIRRYQRRYDEALVYYNKAMDICKSNSIVRGLTIFNTNAGIAAYDSGDREEAKRYFNAAIRIYNKFDILWRRSIAEGYLGLLEIEDGEINNGYDHLQKAITYMNTIQNPIEMNTIKRIIKILNEDKNIDKNKWGKLDTLLKDFNI